jgi:acyl carrier protein
MEVSTETRVIRAIQPYCQMPVTLDATISSLNLSSLDFMCAVSAVEEEFDTDIPTEKFPSIKTVRDISVVLTEALRANGHP